MPKYKAKHLGTSEAKIRTDHYKLEKQKSNAGGWIFFIFVAVVVLVSLAG